MPYLRERAPEVESTLFSDHQPLSESFSNLFHPFGALTEKATKPRNEFLVVKSIKKVIPTQLNTRKNQ
jgi:hypothetical protein